MRRLGLLLVPGACVLSIAAPVFAHGDLQATSPQRGANVGTAPDRVTITLTEAPSKGAQARAVDGCKRKVPADVSVDGSDVVLSLQGGGPGRWKVSYRAVSSVDGHLAKGSFGFTVSGTEDCPAKETEEPDDIDAADNPGIVENPNPPDDGVSWILWVVGGTVVISVAASLVRRSSR